MVTHACDFHNLARSEPLLAQGNDDKNDRYLLPASGESKCARSNSVCECSANHCQTIAVPIVQSEKASPQINGQTWVHLVVLLRVHMQWDEIVKGAPGAVDALRPTHRRMSFFEPGDNTRELHLGMVHKSDASNEDTTQALMGMPAHHHCAPR